MENKVKRPIDIDIPKKAQYIIICNSINFLELFKKIEKRHKNCFIFESLGEESYLSRYSLIGFDPDGIFYAKENCLMITWRSGINEIYPCENPYQLLREITPRNVISRNYVGGLTGYLGYDCINLFEPSLNIKKSDSFDIFKFGLYKDGLLFDKMTNEIIYFYYQINRIDEIKEIINEPYSGNGPVKVKILGDSMSRNEHENAVKIGRRNIIEGNIFQCEVGFRSEYEINGDYLNIYEKLREVNPSPHMYFMKFNDERIIGASPELLLKIQQGEMVTYPLAGTTTRGRTPEEDKELARCLLKDKKEVAEHNMLVDLHRNDLGRVAKFGTVKVRRLMDVKRYSHVQHISSEIVGIMNTSEDMFSVVASNFPAGTLSGSPKIEAIKIIDLIEKEGRGPYGGGVGTFSFNGDCTFAIPIRTLFCKGNQAYVQTCGGNVYDSTPMNEYEEIKSKLASTETVLNMFADVSSKGSSIL